VSFENSFDSKQPKLEPKLVSALSETKLLFRLFRFYTETASFDVSVEPKQEEDQPKQTETNRNEVKWAQNWNKNYEISCNLKVLKKALHSWKSSDFTQLKKIAEGHIENQDIYWKLTATTTASIMDLKL
jgi:hypothetical protein